MLKIKYLKWILHLNRTRNDFRLITVLIFSLSIINIFYKFNWTDEGLVSAFNLWNPSWLLFGPLLFFAFQTLINKSIKVSFRDGLHLLPFLIVSCLYIFVYLTTNMSDPWKNVSFTWYQNSYGVIAFSLLPYSLYILGKLLKTNHRNNQDADSLVVSIAVMYILICVVLFMMLMGWWMLHAQMGFDYRYLSYGLLLFINLSILGYWIVGDKTDDKEVIESDTYTQSYKNSLLTEEQALDYKERITSYFEYNAVYLDSSITIDLLAKELSVPKHYFSQLFNVYFEKSFHIFVAEYRISHAINLLNSNKGRLKIESLAYACGFNSKTSFNKYFKEITGVTPSEYQLDRQIA